MWAGLSTAAPRREPAVRSDLSEASLTLAARPATEPRPRKVLSTDQPLPFLFR